MTKRRSTIWTVTVYAAGTMLLMFLAYEFDHSKQLKFTMTWFPGNSYPSTAKLFPEVGANGEPRVVLVRRVDHFECYEIYYSTLLMTLLQKTPSHQTQVTYRVRYRFGRSHWIETLDVGGLGIQPISSYDVSGQIGRGDCFQQ